MESIRPALAMTLSDVGPVAGEEPFSENHVSSDLRVVLAPRLESNKWVGSLNSPEPRANGQVF